MKKQILFVDDEPLILDSLRRMLRPQRHVWEMMYVDRPETAWQWLLTKQFDAVVCDVKMPGINGLQLLERIGRSTKTNNVPVIMLTGLFDHVLKRQALDLGAADLLNKPIEREDLLARLRSVLRLKEYQDELLANNDLLEQQVEQRTEDLYYSRLDMIWRLAKAAEYRDEETGDHVIRVGCFSRIIAEELGMDRHFVETIFMAAPLHDIGKIGIPDAILLKRGSLSRKQWEKMKQHCLIGANILRQDSKVRTAFLRWRGTNSLSEVRGFDNPLLRMSAAITLTHHEKWDGTGYPQGLADEEIPIESRIVAISDVFDAMTSRRPYKAAYSVDSVVESIGGEIAAHFDPVVYEAFVRVLPEIRSVREQFNDSPEDSTNLEEAWNEKDLVCG